MKEINLTENDLIQGIIKEDNNMLFKELIKEVEGLGFVVDNINIYNDIKYQSMCVRTASLKECGYWIARVECINDKYTYRIMSFLNLYLEQNPVGVANLINVLNKYVDR